MESLKNDDIHMRLRNESLAMGAIVAYQFNAIIYHPAEGRAESVLLEAACQHIVDGNGCSYPSLYTQPEGCYFLSDVVKTDKSHHLPTVRPLDSAVLESLYRRDSIHNIEAKFLDYQTPGQKHKKTHLSISHPLKRRKTTTNITKNTDDSEWTRDNLDTDNMNDGSETGDGNGIGDEQADSEDTNMSAFRQLGEDLAASQSLALTQATGHAFPAAIQHIMRRFPADIFEHVPKRRTGDQIPWILPDMTAKQLSNIGLFKTFDLSGIFRMAQYKFVADKEWEILVFNRYFPPKGICHKAKLQHFSTAKYYQAWTALLEGIDIPRAEKLRGHFFIWFQKLWWVPFPEPDRMWIIRKIAKR